MTRRFHTVLVANRGEIAYRILRTARAEGYRTVAVYSDADAHAPHVAMADQAMRLGSAPSAQSYLNMERVLEAARESGADAIHPGYGFLSENGAFADACAEAGITFIGPPASAIAALGNKAAAKRIMRKAGVPCVPGYEDTAQDDETLAREAQGIGFPVLLKAAAGGGGRGMRRVYRKADFAEALRGARSEALKAFGSDELIIEKFVEHARHVEIQVLADAHGNVLHLGERDCSVQRRHQKVLEEAPGPAVTPELRQAMGEAAVSAARAAGYVNAGTVEFLLDDHGNFYFLEVNTRLQVEHPVTELVTGLDIVALQLAIAQGDRLPLEQHDIRWNGHAIEARLCAEDPAADFAPQSGRVLRWKAPEGLGVRVDHGLSSGLEISPYYDSMLAKIIAWGATRDEALRRLDMALRDTVALGIKTNVEFLRKAIGHPDFAGGAAHTDFIETTGIAAAAPSAPDATVLLAAAAAFIERDARRVPAHLRGWRSTGRVNVPLKLECGGETLLVSVSMSGHVYSIECQGATFEIEVLGCDEKRLRFRAGSPLESVDIAFDGDILHLKRGDVTVRFTDRTYAPPATSDAASDGVLKAPMIGQVIRLNAVPGAAVAKGDVLVVIEAMKMENQVIAPRDGVVASVSVSLGDQVNANQVLLTMQHDVSNAS